MSFAACEKCWDAPCTCGHQYRNWSPDKLWDQIEMLKGVRREKVRNEPPELSELAESTRRGCG